MGEDIKNIGGFLDSKGNLIQEPLTQKNKPKATDESTQNDDGAKIQLDNGQSLDKALSSVSRRSREGVDSAIRANDQAEADIKSAKAVVTEQKKVLKQIEKEENAKKPDAEKIEKLKQRFGELEEKRDAIASSVEKNNRQRVEEGPQAVRVGNKTVASFKPEKVEFEKRKFDIDTEEGRKEATKALKEDTKSLNRQAKEVRSERERIGDASQRAREEIKEVSKKAGSGEAPPIKSFDEASKIANNTSNLIRQYGSSSVGAATKGLSSETVSRLLQF